MMILNSLIIDNIRSYEHAETEFPKGISLFEGDNGSGKSTILMSVEFALFGLGSQKAEALLAKKAQTGYVILDFSMDGKRYEIKRALLRKDSSVNQDPKKSWIKVDDVKEPLSPSELKQRVLQILKFNEPADPRAESRIFRYAIFMPQEAMKDVLFDPKRRLETIRRAFGIEDYSTAESNAHKVLSEIRIKSASLKERFSDVSRLESEVYESNKEISRLESEISQKQAREGILEEEKGKKMQEIRELQARNNEKTRLDSERASLCEMIDTDNTQKDRLEQELGGYETRLREIDKELEELQGIERPETAKSIPDITSEIERFQKVRDTKIGLESEKSSIQQDIAQLRESLGGRLDSERETVENELDNMLQEVGSLEETAARIKEREEEAKEQRTRKKTLRKALEGEILKFDQLGTTCPTCRQEITERHHHDLVDSMKEEVRTLTAELESIEDSLFESNAESRETRSRIESCEQSISQIQIVIPRIKEYSMKSERYNRLDVEIGELEEILSDSEFKGRSPIEYLTELKDKMMKFESMSGQIKQINKTKHEVEKIITDKRREAESITSLILGRRAEIEQVKSEIGSFVGTEERIRNEEDKLDSLVEQIRKVSNTSAEFRADLKSQTAKIKDNELKIIKSRKDEVRYKKIEQFRQWLDEFFIPTISQIEKQVLLSILQNFNETYIRWYSILVEDPTKESRIDEDFTPIVNQDGFDQEIGYLSGGEKTSIALAYRLTLNSLMRKETMSLKSNLLILDEPTDGFSKNQLVKIREVLEELKSEQIVLVSHERELEAYVDNIFQISKQNGISSISRITDDSQEESQSKATV